MEELIIKIENDIKINERCLEEKDADVYVRSLLRLWINFDEELLAIIRRLNK